jgi:hypothetical protein
MATVASIKILPDRVAQCRLIRQNLPKSSATLRTFVASDPPLQNGKLVAQGHHLKREIHTRAQRQCHLAAAHQNTRLHDVPAWT